MQIINGQEIADNILVNCRKLLSKSTSKPILAIIMVGNNPASLTYIEKKRQAGEKAGIIVELYKYDSASNQEMLSLIAKLNKQEDIFGIILQLPAPGLDQYLVCKAIDPRKDVDGLNPENFGELWLSTTPKLIPATVKAIRYTLEFIATKERITYENYISAKNVLIINRSNIIGKPLAGMLLNQDATVTLAHSKTDNLDDLISNSDIVISGTGKENFIQNQNFKDNAVLIDVGFNKTNDRIYGDVNQQSTTNKIGWLTPVPGGIGPIGVACLIENVIEVFTSQQIS